MVQGDKYVNNQIGTNNHPIMSDASKRNGFLALQKQLSDKGKSSNVSSHKTNGPAKTTSNWGPFKNKDDFINMHLC